MKCKDKECNSNADCERYVTTEQIQQIPDVWFVPERYHAENECRYFWKKVNYDY